ncbi:LacI family DNA-binding transcriptional regulator [Paenibacillus puldeungensis]|uniref:LacI family DNA-binding transcriptional regulator n=1 Tax=Paenibacillus puldeungensis TaxID=696536 RepID=A0ABW3S0I8_9BACL
MAVTIREVARRAGVSISTVSRALSGQQRVRAENLRKVQQIVNQIEFCPSAVAKSLVSRTANAICLVLPKPTAKWVSNPFFMELIRGIVARANRSNYDIIISSGASEQEELKEVSRLFRGGRVDGAILLSSRKEDAVIDFMKMNGYPFVLIGRSDKYDGIWSVDTDNRAAAGGAVNHLVTMGHKRIGFVSGPSNLVVSVDRMEGYKRALRENGLTWHPEWVFEGELLLNSGYRSLSYFMNQPDRPTALVVYDDLVALGVIRALNKLEIKVPDDLALVSFNNIPLAELSIPPISSIDIGIYHLGDTAAQVFIQNMQHANSEFGGPKRLIIPHELIVRESSMIPIHIF